MGLYFNIQHSSIQQKCLAPTAQEVQVSAYDDQDLMSGNSEDIRVISGVQYEK